MAMTVELTTKQFMKLFGHKKFVKNFSKESVEIILAEIGEDQYKHGSTNVTWQSYFKKYREINDATVVAENNEMIDELATEILAMSSGLLGLSDETYAQIDDEDITDDSELLLKIIRELEAANGWQEGVASVIAKAKNYRPLEYGNYLVLNESEQCST